MKLLAPLFIVSATCVPLAESAHAQCTTRVSVDSQGVAGNWYSGLSVITPDGRYVAFETFAWNLAKQDRNNEYDVFVHDRATGETTCISLDPNGVPSDGHSQGPSLSADARWIAYGSTATNLVAGDVNGDADVFLHDRVTGTNQLASVAFDGGPVFGHSAGAALSGDGRFLAFESWGTNVVAGDLNQLVDVFVRDLTAGTNQRVSVGIGGVESDDWSGDASLSENGRWIAFTSRATNLVAGDTNGVDDVFVRDLVAQTTVRVSVGALGQQGNAKAVEPVLSSDGRRVVFLWFASNVDPADTNNWCDVYLRDLAAGTTELVSVNSSGVIADAPNYSPTLSPDGRFVAFGSEAKNLSALDTNQAVDVFVRDLASGTTQLASLKSDGTQAKKGCFAPSLAALGRAVSFSSQAQLVPEKHDALTDVFVRDTFCDITTYCTAKVNSQSCVPTLTTTGTPNLGGFENFRVHVAEVLPQKSGLLVWGFGAAATPFAGGLLCVEAPFVRTTARMSDGDPAVDCSGTYEFPFTQSYMAAQGLTAGTEIYAQVWSRDPGYTPPDDIGLTDAVRFVIAP